MKLVRRLINWLYTALPVLINHSCQLLRKKPQMSSQGGKHHGIPTPQIPCYPVPGNVWNDLSSELPTY